MSQKIPYIQGNLLSNSVDEGKMANHNILFDDRVADLAPDEFDRVQPTMEYEDEDSGIKNTKKKRKRDVSFDNDVSTAPKKKKKRTEAERDGAFSELTLENSSLIKKKKKKLKLEGENTANDDEDFTGRMLEAIKDMEGLKQEKSESDKGRKKKKKIKGKDQVSNELITTKSLLEENLTNESHHSIKVAASNNVRRDEAKKPRKVPPYALFNQDNRKKLKLEHPDMSFAEIAKKMGEMWRSLSQEEKETYKSKAKSVNEEKFHKWNLKNPGVDQSKARKKKGEDISTEDKAFSSFMQEKRPSLAKSYPSLSKTDTDRMIAEMWKNCTLEQKNHYDKRVQDAIVVDEQNASTKSRPHSEGVKKKPGKTSSYMVFFQEIRPRMIERFPNRKFVEISQLAGNLWNKLTEVEKDEYKRKAEVLNNEKLQRWALENSSNEGSPVIKKAATPRNKKGKNKGGTPSGEASHQSQG